MLRTSKPTRKVSRWNAYLHSQVEAFNEGLQPGQARPKVHEIAKGIRERWDNMTDEERIAATEDAVLELEDIRESKQAAKRESRISTTRDIRTTLDAIESELRDLYNRTGAEILLVSVRSDVENFSTKPRVFTSSSRVQDFFQLSTNRTVNDFAVKLQAYCVADIQAPIVSPTLNMQQQVIEMKRKVKEIINSTLQECARPAKVARINYVDFETSITERHGIICENWPLPNFCAPGSINSLAELEVLYRAWSTGVTSFRRLTPEEWHQFKENRTQQRLQAAILQTTIAAANSAQATHSEQMLEACSSSSPIAGPSTTSRINSPELPQPTLSRESTIGPLSREEVPRSPAALPGSPSLTVQEGLQYPPVDDPSPTPSCPADSSYPPQMMPSTSATASTPPLTVPQSDAMDEYVLLPDAASTFVFSSGKRPPPSSFNILGPMGLVSKKPRKTRVDAGIKRGPNKRTTGKGVQPVTSQPSISPADDAQMAVAQDSDNMT